jgi:hypothetical protein
VLASRSVGREEKRQINHALFHLQRELPVVISTLAVPLQDWEHGLYQVLQIRRQIERDPVAA